jgi:CelD/BcsL family acetyltransferase involved in cellulose biosynthesis
VEWRDLAALAAIADDWRALAARALEPNVFYEPAFAMAAAPMLGADAGAMLVWSKTRLIGLFPARIERWRYGPQGALVGWTHDYGPLGVPLIDRDQPAAAVEAFLDHLTGDASMPALLLLPLIPRQGAFAAVLDAAIARRGLRARVSGAHRRALLAPGAARAGYLERAISAPRRKELRRQRRRLGDIAPVTFRTAASAPEIGPALRDFLVLEASGWKGRAGTAAAEHPAVRRFMETAVAALAAEGKARVDRLYLNSSAIAATVTLVSGNTAWLWKIAHSEGVARASPGVQLMLDMTDAVLADKRLERADSCATADHAMIDHIWRERLALGDRLIAVRATALPFGLACCVEALRRGVRSSARALRDQIRGR